MSTETHAHDAFEFDVDAGEFSKEDFGGDIVDHEGTYHFEFADVEAKLDTVDTKGNFCTPHVLFTLAVCHTVPGQSPQGSRFFHRVYLAAKGGEPAAPGTKKAAVRFAVQTGLMEFRDVEGKEVPHDKQKPTGDTSFNWRRFFDLRGTQIVAKLGMSREEEDSKYRPRLEAKRFWEVDDPAVASVPKSGSHLALLGKEGATSALASGRQDAAHDDISDL